MEAYVEFSSISLMSLFFVMMCSRVLNKLLVRFTSPAGIYLFKATIETPEQCVKSVQS